MSQSAGSDKEGAGWNCRKSEQPKLQKYSFMKFLTKYLHGLREIFARKYSKFVPAFTIYTGTVAKVTY